MKVELIKTDRYLRVYMITYTKRDFPTKFIVIKAISSDGNVYTGKYVCHGFKFRVSKRNLDEPLIRKR